MKIHNNYITGFVDGCIFSNFIVCQKKLFTENKCIVKNKKCTNYKFVVHLHKKSANVLYALKQKFKCGKVTKKENDMYTFSVCKKNNLQKYIIPFFIKYPLQSANRMYFYEYLKNFYACHTICFSAENMHSLHNYALYNENFLYTINNEWFSGFVDCLGDFFVCIKKKNKEKNTKNVENFTINIQMTLCVHVQNKNLLFNVKNFLNCGNITVHKESIVFSVTDTKSLIEKIFPKLYTKTSKNLLKTMKRVKFQKFRKIVIMMYEKKIFMPKNIVKILKLKNYIDTH